MPFHSVLSVSVVCLFALFFFETSSAERVAIQAGKSFCVFDDLKANVPWGVQFQCDEHDIRVVIRGPNKVLHNGTPETYGSYSFKTEDEGRYSVCFENPAGSIQKVSFNFLGQDSTTTTPAEKPDQIQIELQELNNGLKFIQNEQDYMIQRGKIHAQIAKNSNSRIHYWFVFEILLLGACVAFEIFYLKSFFEKRRVV